MTIQDQPVIKLTEGPCSAELIPFGAALRALWVPDRDGRPTDVCLGYDDLAAYQALGGCLGGTLGRCANRIGGARFTLNGQEYRLTANQGTNQIHGGFVGFHKKFWQFSQDAPNSVTFTLDSPDGEEGFPGNLHAAVTYTLEHETLFLDYQAVSDRDTVVNLTNHSYFNLAGQNGGPVTDHILTVQADCYTPAGPDNVPLGDVAPVDGTPLDLRQGAVLGDRLSELPGGYDHNMVLSGQGTAATLYCPRTGIFMEVETTLEGMQLYTANSLSQRPGKAGAVYDRHHGVCFETQHFPDAINHPNFPSPVLRAGQTLQSRTAYRFSLRT